MSRVLISTMRSLDKNAGYGKLLRLLAEKGVEVVAVVANTEFREHVTSVFPSASFFRRGLGEWPPQKTQFLSSTTDTVAQFLRLQEFPSFKLGVMGALNRHDASGTFRMIDREAYFFHNLYEITEGLVSNGVTHVFFDVTPHVAREYILFWVAKKLGLQVVFLQPVPFAGVSLLRSDVDQFWTRKFSVWDSSAGKNLATLVTKQATQLLESLAHGNAYWVSKYQNRELEKLSRSPLNLYRLLRKLRLPKLSSNDVHLPGENMLPKIVRVGVIQLLTLVLRKSFQRYRLPTNITDISDRDIFFALTHEPERTFFPEAIPYLSQLELVPMLAGVFPGMRRILIKEHATQLVPGRSGYASRTIWGYAWLEKLESVHIMDSRLSARRFVRDCGVVVSATGTICLEAAILGTVAFHYGNPWWEGFPGTAKISPDMVVDLDKRHASSYTPAGAEAFFSELVMRSIPSTANVEPADFREKYASLPAGFEELEIRSLVELVGDFVKE